MMERFIDQQDAADRERVTDTNFIIYGKKKKKYHLECESSLPDRRMTVRLFEYDAQIALDEGEIINETLTATYHPSAILRDPSKYETAKEDFCRIVEKRKERKE